MQRLSSIDSAVDKSIGQEASPVWTWLKSHQVLVQALMVWIVLCLPGNVVTLVLFGKVSNTSMISNDSDLLNENFCLHLNENPDCGLNKNSTACWQFIQRAYDWGPCHGFGNTSFSKQCVLQHFKLDLDVLIQTCTNQVRPLNLTYTCHEPIDKFNDWVVTARFWLEGVAVIVVGIFGLAGNVLTVLVLRRIETNVMFNKLLMSLGKIDSFTKNDAETSISNLSNQITYLAISLETS